MANSNTAHSKKLRAETAKKATTEKLKSGIYAQMSLMGKKQDIDELRTGLSLIDGSTNIEKIKKAVDFYIKNNP